MGLNIIKHKKGVFFTLSGIILLIFLLGYFTVQLNTNSFDALGTNNRLTVVDAFLDSVYIDGEFALNTATFRGFLALNDHISNTGEYVDDIELRIEEAILNETVYNTSYTVLGNNSLSHWSQKIIEFAGDFRITTNITFGDISLTQTNPWFADISIETTIILFDQISKATWNETRFLTSQVSIEGIYDPLYIIETNNQYSIYFEQTPYETFVVGTNSTNLTNHIIGQYYAQFDDAPSFLNRFTGSLEEGGSLGIESLIDKNALSDAIAVDLDASNSDYIYFSTRNVTIHNFTSVLNDFHLDNISTGLQSHITQYNLNGLVT